MHTTISCHPYKIVPAYALALLSFTETARACELPTTLSHTVTAVTDTRSLKLDDGSELRLAAVLGPTPYDSPAAPKIWPPEQNALAALKALALNENVAISLERTARDRYGRRVGHALLVGNSDAAESNVDGRWLQARMVRAGHARVALTPEIDQACAKRLLALEAAADVAQRGLWSSAAYRPKRAEDIHQLRRYRSTFQIIEGIVVNVSIRRSAVYLNFGKNWKRDFTAKLSRTVLKRARIKPSALKILHKNPVRIRGWLEQRNGPLITIWRLDQIEQLTLAPTGETRRLSPPRLLSELKSGQQTNTPRHQR